MTAYKNLQIKSGLPIKEILEVDAIILRAWDKISNAVIPLFKGNMFFKSGAFILSQALSKKLSLENFKALAVSFSDLRMERDKDGKTTIKKK